MTKKKKEEVEKIIEKEDSKAIYELGSKVDKGQKSFHFSQHAKVIQAKTLEEAIDKLNTFLTPQSNVE